MNDHIYWLIAVMGIAFPSAKFYLELKKEDISMGQRIIHLGYGVTGSIITMFFLFELAKYLGINDKLSLMIGAGAAYLGGEFFKQILIKFIDKKIENMK